MADAERLTTGGEPATPATPATPAGAGTAGGRAERRPSFRKRLWQNPSARTGLLLLGVIIALCLFGPLVVQQDPNKQDLSQVLESPSREHLLGTDSYGRDILSRLMYGGRASITLGLVAVFLGVAIGFPVGSLSGFYGGRSDSVLQRITEVVISFPGILLALGLVAVLGVGIGSVIIAVTVSSIPVFIRLSRASALTIRELPYIEAATALGMPRRQSVYVHVMPNSIAPIIVQGSLQVGLTILTLAGLGFLGLGVPPPDPEWGAMLGEARGYIFRSPWLSIWPGLAIFLVVIAFNLLGDGLRTVLNPRDRT